MRTQIDIDDLLLAEAMTVSGLPSKEATIEDALRRLVSNHRRREAIEGIAGIGWCGDLERSRSDRAPDADD